MYCKDCKYYKSNSVDGPYCTKSTKPRPVSPLRKMDCFVEPSGDDEVAAILASVPDKSVEEAPVEKPKHRGGRPKTHPNYEDENGVTMKWCRMCQQYKPLDEFGKKSSAADGHTYECKKCKVDHQLKKRDEKRQSRPAPARKKQPEVILEMEEKKDPVLGWVAREDKVTDTYLKVPVLNPSCAVEVKVAYNPGDKFVTIIIRTIDER